MLIWHVYMLLVFVVFKAHFKANWMNIESCQLVTLYNDHKKKVKLAILAIQVTLSDL